jgi:hypothetical protein
MNTKHLAIEVLWPGIIYQLSEIKNSESVNIFN